MTDAATKTRTRWEPWMAITIALSQDDMSQKELAELLGWETSKVSRIARGKQEPKAMEVYEIARAQGRDIAWYYAGPGSLESEEAKGVYLSSISRLDVEDLDHEELAELIRSLDAHPAHDQTEKPAA